MNHFTKIECFELKLIEKMLWWIGFRRQKKQPPQLHLPHHHRCRHPYQDHRQKLKKTPLSRLEHLTSANGFYSKLEPWEFEKEDFLHYLWQNLLLLWPTNKNHLDHEAL